MKTIAIVLSALALTGASLRADDTTQPPNSWTTKVVQVKHVQPPDSRVFDLLQTLGVKASGPVNGYLALAGPKEAVAAAEEFLAKMDANEKTEPDVDFHGWLLIESAHDMGGFPSPPPELASVAKQLGAAFGFRNLHLLTSFELRSRIGHPAMTNGEIPFITGEESGHAPMTYNFRFNRVDVAGGTAGQRRLRITTLEFECRIPNKGSVNINDAVDLTEGQKVVIGKTSMAFGTEVPLILVLSAQAASSD